MSLALWGATLPCHRRQRPCGIHFTPGLLTVSTTVFETDWFQLERVRPVPPGQTAIGCQRPPGLTDFQIQAIGTSCRVQRTLLEIQNVGSVAKGNCMSTCLFIWFSAPALDVPANSTGETEQISRQMVSGNFCSD